MRKKRRIMLKLLDVTKLLQSPGKYDGSAVDGGQLRGTEYTITVNPELSVRDDWARLEPIDSYLAQNLLVNPAAGFPEFSKKRGLAGS